MPCSQMMSMNCNPPREMAARKPAALPVEKARILKSRRLNIGDDHAVLDDEERDEEDDADDEGDEHARRRPAHGVVQVGLDAVDDADEDRRESDREGEVAPPVDRGRRRACRCRADCGSPRPSR